MNFSQEDDVQDLLRLKRGNFRAIIRQNHLQEIFAQKRQEFLNTYSDSLVKIFAKLEIINSNELSDQFFSKYKCSLQDVQYLQQKIEEAQNFEEYEVISLILFLIGENDFNQLQPFINEKVDCKIVKKYLQINQFGHNMFKLFVSLFKNQSCQAQEIIPEFLIQINQQVGQMDVELFGDYCILFYQLSLMKLVEVQDISILARQSLKFFLLNNKSEMYKYAIASISEVYDLYKREIISDIIVQFINHLAFEVIDQQTSELAMNTLGRFLSADDYQTYSILCIVEKNLYSTQPIIYLDERLISVLECQTYSIQYRKQALLALSNLIASEIDILNSIHQRGNLLKLVYLLEKENNSELRQQYLICIRNAVSFCDKIILIDLLQNNIVGILNDIAFFYILEEFKIILQIFDALHFQCQIDPSQKQLIDNLINQTQIHQLVDKYYNETKNENLKDQCHQFFEQIS